MYRLTIVFAVVFSLSCKGAPGDGGRSDVGPNSVANRNAAPTATASASPTPTPFPNAPPVDPSKIKRFNGRGKVTKINLELGSVELDHEEIKGHMPRMIMEFFVTERSELEPLQIGDAVDFVLEEYDGQEKIVNISKSR